MRTAHLVAAVAAGIVAGSVASAVFSPAGIIAYTALHSYRAELRANLDSLTEINQRLSAYQQALTSSPELIRLQARQLNYYREGERVIRIQDGPRPASFYEVGRVVARPPAFRNQRAGFVVLGLAAGVMVYIALLLVGRRRTREQGGGNPQDPE